MFVLNLSSAFSFENTFETLVCVGIVTERYNMFGTMLTHLCPGAKKEALKPMLAVPKTLQELMDTRVNTTIVGSILNAIGTKITFVLGEKLNELSDEGVCFNSVIAISPQFPDDFEDAFSSEHFLWK